MSSKYYNFKSISSSQDRKIGDIIIYPKNIKEYTGIVFSYETKWPFPYNPKEWPKVPKDEEITFNLPTLIKGDRQINFKELHFILPK
jgi:hypothetical protein